LYDDYKRTCLHFLDFGLDQLDDNSHTTNGGDSMCHGPGGDNQMTTEGEFFHLFATLRISS
jgi:hypothetical protein